MKINKFLLGVSVGFITGLFLNTQKTTKFISAEKALKMVKQTMKEHGPIEGSWIHMVPETTTLNQLNYNVYRGGISRTIDGKLKQYEFIVDAKTGTILNIKETT